MARRQRIAVIGAGIGGLSAAAILSRRFEVDVFERAPQAGGKVRQIMVDGRPIDSGPTVFTMKWAFEEVFEAAGASLDDHVTLRKLDVLARHGWRDGARLDLFADIDRSADAIGDFAGARDAANFRRFCKTTRTIYDTLRDPFMRRGAPSFWNLFTGKDPVSLLKTNPFSTMWGALSATFEDHRLRQLFGRYATYCGSSPFQAPATLMLVAHVEQEGVWTLDGGMLSIAKALQRVATANGARFHFGAHVSGVHVQTNRAAGVELASGDRHQADLVVMNGDVAALSSGVLGGDAAKAVRRPAGAERSQSALTWSMVAEASGFDLAEHNVFFSDDYPGEFDAVFKRRAVPSTPTTYLFAPDRGVETPPQGPERLFALINAPAIGDAHAFPPEEIARCRTTVLDHLRTCGLTLSEPHPDSVATSPADFAQMFPATGGALYGMASHGWRASFQRPGVRARLPGLYLAGGSAHPGPGVPMAALSGRAAARAICKDYGSTSTSRQADMRGGTSTPSATTASSA